MEENIKISNINDFIFCPRSIYFHNIYSSYEEKEYYSNYQISGKLSHEKIDKKEYSSKKSILEGLDIYSEEFGVIGKIDLLDTESGILIERKNKIKKIYEGYYLQIYAQYFCLLEMGYKVKKIVFHSLSDNKRYNVDLPTSKNKERLKEIIESMKKYSLEDKFEQNINKCKMCIYKELCDVYQNVN